MVVQKKAVGHNTKIDFSENRALWSQSLFCVFFAKTFLGFSSLQKNKCAKPNFPKKFSEKKMKKLIKPFFLKNHLLFYT